MIDLIKRSLLLVAAGVVAIPVGLFVGGYIRSQGSNIEYGDYGRFFENEGTAVILLHSGECVYCALAVEYLQSRRAPFLLISVDEGGRKLSDFEASAVPVLMSRKARVVGFHPNDYNLVINHE